MPVGSDQRQLAVLDAPSNLEATLASRDVRPQPTGVLHYPVISDPPATAPDRPIEIKVIEITLHPEGALQADLVPGLAMLKVESGRLVAIDVDGFGNPLPQAELGQGSRFPGLFPPGRVFRSGNDQPVRLLLVTIVYANPPGNRAVSRHGRTRGPPDKVMSRPPDACASGRRSRRNLPLW